MKAAELGRRIAAWDIGRTAGGLLAHLGRVIGAIFGYIGEIFILGHQTVTHILRGEVTRRETFDQLAVVGFGGLALVAITVMFSGMVFGLYTVDTFRTFGASEMIGALVGMSMTREIAPVLAATVVAARTGSAIAAEVSTMKITEQVDALRALATSPIEYLAVPRYIALVLTLPMLTLVGSFAGIMGAGLVGTLKGLPWPVFIESIRDRLPFDYVITGCVKAMVFGALIALASLRQGFRVGFGSEAVGRATTAAVVLDIIWIHGANLLLAVATS